VATGRPTDLTVEDTMHPDARSTGRRPIRVLLAAELSLVRTALRGALEAAGDLEVVGEAGDAAHCRYLAAAVRPDVVLLHLAEPGNESGEHVRRLARHPGPQVVVVAAVADGAHVRRALDAGAVGYLLEDVEPQGLRDAVRAVVRGESPLDPRAVRAMLRARPVARGEDLTVREREVLALVTQGLANKQIARELAISDSTVKAHIGSIFTRIGVADRTSAALWAERNLRPRSGVAGQRQPVAV
jgi:DNA-binding NarL/FixJ family response regulator